MHACLFVSTCIKPTGATVWPMCQTTLLSLIQQQRQQSKACSIMKTTRALTAPPAAKGRNHTINHSTSHSCMEGSEWDSKHTRWGPCVGGAIHKLLATPSARKPKIKALKSTRQKWQACWYLPASACLQPAALRVAAGCHRQQCQLIRRHQCQLHRLASNEPQDCIAIKAIVVALLGVHMESAAQATFQAQACTNTGPACKTRRANSTTC